MELTVKYIHPAVELKTAVMDGRTYQLIGECIRCGACCKHYRPQCSHLAEESRDGVRESTCKVYYERPVGCALWPLPGDDFSSCTRIWVRIE